MRVLAINGSPRGAKGNTDCIVQPFLEGAREAGADTETLYLKECEINHCLGCFNCWTKTPGVCVHQDDMTPLYDKLFQSDVWVLGTPVYWWGPSAQLKAFIDRNRFYRRHGWKMKAKGAGIIVIAGGRGIEDTDNALMSFIALSSNIVAEKVLKTHGFARTQGEIESNTAIVELARTLGKNLTEELLGT